jgi:thiamine pyrophosphokinase
MPAEEGVSNEIVVVIAGGGGPAPATAALVPSGAVVIAADSGLDHASALGLEVTSAVGDFDSASADAVARAETAGVRIARHPEAKNETDLELAMEEALEFRPKRILVLGSRGGRLDHLVAALLLLGSERYASAEIDAILDVAHLRVIRGERELRGEPGELVSLFALHGSAEGVRTEGLVYPLADETLEPGSSRGVSNVFAATTARVRVRRGVVLAVQPKTEEVDP